MSKVVDTRVSNRRFNNNETSATHRAGVDEEGSYKKTETFLHKGGVQEFVELMCKEKQHLHPEMKVT